MCDNIETPDFKDYFREYLSINYAGLENPGILVEQRNAEAVREFETVYRQHGDKDTAYEMAVARLLEGYGFSKYDFMENILREELGPIPDEAEADRLCRRLIRECEPIFARYPLTADDEISSSNRELGRELRAYVRRISSELL